MDEPLRALVETSVGPIRSVADRSWAHAVTQVWRVEAGGQIVWVKRHSQERKYLQEARAYETVVPGLASRGVAVPALLARAAAWRALVISDLPGAPADPGDLAAARRAGEIASILHGLPFADPDPVPVASALVARLDGWVARAHVVDDDLGRAAREQLGDGSAFSGLGRRLCHRDYSARNWIVRDADVGIIDFEHSGPDLWLMDLTRLAESASPEVFAAFMAGYGPVPAEAWDQLRRLLWLTGLATVVWARQHGDAQYEAAARSLLDRLKSGWTPRPFGRAC